MFVHRQSRTEICFVRYSPRVVKGQDFVNLWRDRNRYYKGYRTSSPRELSILRSLPPAAEMSAMHSSELTLSLGTAFSLGTAAWGAAFLQWLRTAAISEAGLEKRTDFRAYFVGRELFVHGAFVISLWSPRNQTFKCLTLTVFVLSWHRFSLSCHVVNVTSKDHSPQWCHGQEKLSRV